MAVKYIVHRYMILLLCSKPTGFLFSVEIFIDLFDNQHIHLYTLHNNTHGC